MKRFAYLFSLLILLALVTSCEKDNDNTVLDVTQATAPELVSPDPGSSYDLEEFDGDIFFEWTEADYKMDNLPDFRYRLVAYATDQADSFKEHMFVIHETSDNTAVVSADRINQAIFQLGVMPFEFESVSFRVMSFFNLASDATWLYSKPVELEIRGFELFTFVRVGGTYNEWDYDNENTVLYSPDADNKFEGYLYFEEDNTEVLFSMGASGLFVYGDDDGNGTLDQDGEHIVVAEAGVYRVNLDYDAMTYEFYKTDWALIGSAAEGWGTDVPMDIDEDFWEDNWKVRYTITREFVVGHFKFRANANWDPPEGINLGIDEDAEEEGVLMYGGFGNDIPIDADGVYTVKLDLSGPVYMYEVHPE